MAPQVKARSYDGRQRRAKSAQTKQRILDAARAAILEQGYRATTVTTVATRAGVNVDTVYELVGRKPVLLQELIEQAISGQDRAVPAEERDYVKAIKAEADPRGKLMIYAAAMRRIQTRMAPLLAALRDASATEPEAQEVWQRISQRRAANMRLFIRDLQQADGLRPGMSIDHAADTVWILNSPEVYLLLTTERGWSPRRYERWLVETWSRLFLP